MCRLRFHGHPNMHARRTCLSGAHPRAQLAKTSCMLVCAFELRLTYACIHVCVYACMRVCMYAYMRVRTLACAVRGEGRGFACAWTRCSYVYHGDAGYAA